MWACCHLAYTYTQGPKSQMENFEGSADGKGLKNWSSTAYIWNKIRFNQVMRFYRLPCMSQLSLPGPAQHRWPLPWVPMGRGSQVLRAAAGLQPRSLGVLSLASAGGTGRAARPCPAAPSHHGTLTATNTFLQLLWPHFLSHYAISQYLCFVTDRQGARKNDDGLGKGYSLLH